MCPIRTVLLVLFLSVLGTANIFPALLFARSLPDNADIVSIKLRLAHVGRKTVDAVIIEKAVYISPLDVLSFCGIKAELAEDRKSIDGFFIDEDAKYTLDFAHRICKFGKSEVSFSEGDILSTETETYLRTDVFEKILSLSCKFNFRALEVEINSDKELPAVSNAEREHSLARRLATNSKDHETFDRDIPISRPFMGLGILDWSIASHMSSGLRKPDESYGLAFGAPLFGGDLSARYSGSTLDTFKFKDLPNKLLWQWRYGVIDSRLLTEVDAGSISSFSSIGFSDSILGVQVTNHATFQSEDFGTYTLRDRTEPDWRVELYVNENLTDYAKADIDGNFSFAIPLSYGATSVRLKFYGPNGQVVVKEEDIRIPYSFLKPGSLEYTLTAGTYRSDLKLQRGVAQGRLNLGVSTFMSVSGGATYNRDDIAHPLLPLATVSLAPFSTFLLNGTFVAGTSVIGNLDWTLGSTSIAGSYTYFTPFAGAIRQGDSRRFSFSSPLPFNSASILLQASDQDLGHGMGQFTSSGQVYGELFGVPISISPTAFFSRDHLKFNLNGLSSGLSTSFTVLGLRFRPAAIYDLMDKRVVDLNTSIQCYLGRGTSLGGSYSYSPLTHASAASLDIHLTTGAALLEASGSSDGKNYTGSAGASGSFLFDGKTNEFLLTSEPQVQRAAVAVLPFLDANGNGIYDEGEQLVKGFSVSGAGGHVVKQDNGVVRVLGLNPYASHIMRTSMRGVQNMSLVPAFKSFQVTVGASSFAKVEIPVTSGATVAGSVALHIVHDTVPATDQPLGGARIMFQRRGTDTSIVALNTDLLSYSTGEFYYMGLPPGKYRVFIDPKQLLIKKYASAPEFIDIELKNLTDGDEIDNLNFKLSPISHLPQTVPNTSTVTPPVTPPSTPPTDSTVPAK